MPKILRNIIQSIMALYPFRYFFAKLTYKIINCFAPFRKLTITSQIQSDTDQHTDFVRKPDVNICCLYMSALFHDQFTFKYAVHTNVVLRSDLKSIKKCNFGKLHYF